MLRLNRNQIKWVAFFTMVLDHIAVAGLVSSEWYEICRFIGRISYPLFLVLFIQGFLWTKQPLRHVFDLFLFGCLSEPFFDMVLFGHWIDWSHQNVLWSWSLGLLWLCVLQWILKANAPRIQKFLLSVGGLLISMFVAEWLHVDYSMFGILAMTIFYLFYQLDVSQPIWLPVFWMGLFLSITEMRILPVCATLFFIHYDYEKPIGKKPSAWKKYVFYLLYPLHLAIISFVSICVH